MWVELKVYEIVNAGLLSHEHMIMRLCSHSSQNESHLMNLTFFCYCMAVCKKQTKSDIFHFYSGHFCM